MRFIKENPALAAGIGLPVLLLIFFVVAATISQSLTEPPRYDALFVANYYDQSNDAGYKFKVVNGKVKATVKRSDQKNYMLPRLYRFKAEDNSLYEIVLPDIENAADKQELSIPEAESLTLDTRMTSPDGYLFEPYFTYRSNGWLFPFSSSRKHPNKPVLTKNGRLVSIGDSLTQQRLGDINFLGWITHEGEQNDR